MIIRNKGKYESLIYGVNRLTRRQTSQQADYFWHINLKVSADYFDFRGFLAVT